MSVSDLRVVGRVVNTARYPLPEPAGADWQEVVSRTRQELQRSGCCVLPDFIRPTLLDAVRQECAELAPSAYYDVEVVNAYNIAPDSPLPDDHPGRIIMERGNAFVARDRIPRDFIIHQLYTSQLFHHFIASCFELAGVYELADCRTRGILIRMSSR
jgi:hypothetical protein